MPHDVHNAESEWMITDEPTRTIWRDGGRQVNGVNQYPRWLGVLVATAATGLLVAGVAAAQATNDLPDDVRALEALVGQWMGLRAEMATEQRVWNQRREQWAAELALLEREAETLGREISRGSGLASSVEQEHRRLLARQEALLRIQDQLRPALDRAEAELRAWHAQIPDPLGEELADAFRALPRTQAEADKMPLTRRARAIAALYARIESLQNTVHVTQQMLETAGGTRRQVEVLYIGLSRGFAVTPDNAWAAVGVPGDNGWAWTPAHEAAPAIRAAIAIANRQQTARMVTLPMQVAGEAQP
ncbi:MAG: DUF3450 family protein [Spartobacteria bacterium]|nr:DUF3450 family protein [Spartobacteria bacterium]